MAMMLALLEAVKRALDFLPNVELVTFLFLVFTLLYGKKTYLVSFAFTGVETLVFGSGLWVVMYLYVWPLEILTVSLLHRRFPKDADGYWWYCMACSSAQPVRFRIGLSAVQRQRSHGGLQESRMTSCTASVILSFAACCFSL